MNEWSTYMFYSIVQARKFQEAVKHYTEAIEADPESETAALCLSNRSAAYQQYVHSQNSLSLSLQHTISNPHRLKEYEKAVTDAMKCLSIKPKFSKAYNRLATALKKQGKLRQALEACNKGLKITPDDAGLKKSKATITKKLRNEALKATAGGLSNQMNQQKAAEIQQEINKIAAKAQEFRNKIAALKHENDQSKRNYRRSEICERQVGSLPESTVVYEACGKMFIKSSIKESKTHLGESKVQQTKRQANLEKQLEYNTKKLTETENELREILRSYGAKPSF